MSRAAAERRAQLRDRASVFAALGDETRLSLVVQLSGGEPQSIAKLAEGSRLTRQAITKHLRVLEGAGVVHSTRSGRESTRRTSAPRCAAAVRIPASAPENERAGMPRAWRPRAKSAAESASPVASTPAGG